jgi:cbb3-type cytochrome oxidase maturation protein
MGLEVLYLLIPASILLAVIALGLFIWAIHSGQFDDLETPAIRILFDEGSEDDGLSRHDSHDHRSEGNRSDQAAPGEDDPPAKP